jgi:hypothetical protein
MRYTQPQGGAVAIDWANPITRGLLNVIDGVSGRDLLAGGPTSDSTIRGVGSSGVGEQFSTSAYSIFPCQRSQISDKCTYFLLTDFDSAGNSFLFGDVEAGNVGYNAGLYSNGTNFNFFVKTGGSGTSATSATSAIPVKNLRFGGTYDGANIRIYINGTVDGSAAKTGNVDAGSFSLNLNRWNGTSGHAGRTYLGLRWSRALSAAEHKSLADNPWQIFKSPRRVMMLALSAVALVESGIAVDSCGATVIMGAVGAESAAAADALAVYGLFTAQLAETAAGADSTSSTAALSAARAEALAASDLTAAGSVTMVGMISESGAAADMPAASAQLAATSAATLAANDTTSTGSATIAGSVGESGSAMDAPAAAAQLVAQGSESVASVDSQGAATVGGLLVAEVASATEMASTVSLAVAGATETASGIDTTSSAAVLGATMSETAAATDASNPAGATLAVAITESGTATDQYAALLIAAAASLEQVVANATMASMISASASAMEAGIVFDASWAIVAGQVVYARAPAGPGFAPRRNEETTRPASDITSRPPAIQRNNR